MFPDALHLTLDAVRTMVRKGLFFSCPGKKFFLVRKIYFPTYSGYFTPFRRPDVKNVKRQAEPSGFCLKSGVCQLPAARRLPDQYFLAVMDVEAWGWECHGLAL